MKRSRVNSGRSRYPRATPAPLMTTSPHTPTATGCMDASTTYTLVLASGRPMLGPFRSPLIRMQVASTVHSVGPYTL
ncbi:hypothetical protein D3C87_1194200 [compost metagenome]